MSVIGYRVLDWYCLMIASEVKCGNLNKFFTVACSPTVSIEIIILLFLLQLCQGKPECGRQTLTELLIRPVQRIPSILLLLRGMAGILNT